MNSLIQSPECENEERNGSRNGRFSPSVSITPEAKTMAKKTTKATVANTFLDI